MSKLKWVKKPCAILKTWFPFRSVHFIFRRIMALWFFSAIPLCAQNWNNTGTGDWFTASNWTPATVPNSSLGVLINDGGTVQISTAGAVTQYFSLTSSDIVVQNGGTISSGIFCDINGNALVTGTGSTWGNGSDVIYVGQVSPAGSFNVYNGGSVNSKTAYTYGGTYGNGSITIDGVGSKWTNSQVFENGGTLTIQNGGTAISTGVLYLEGTTTITGAGSLLNSTGESNIYDTVLVEQGGSVTSGDVSVGNGFPVELTVTGSGSNWTSSGTLTSTSGSITVEDGGLISDTNCNGFTLSVTGAGSQWNNSGGFTLGSGGVLNILDGGRVSDASGEVFESVATIDGTNSSWLNTGTCTIDGTLNVQNGGSFTDATAVIAYIYPATVNLTGANTRWQSNADMQVGISRTASVSISNGATATNVNGYIGYGNNNETASVSIDGAGSKWINSSSLSVGYSIQSTGSLTIQDGSVVEVDGGTGGSGNGVVSIATQDDSTGTIQIGNGTSAGTLLASAVEFGPGDGQLVFDHSTVPFTFSPMIQGAGAITQAGVGTTILSGNSSSFTGDTYVIEGALLVSGTLGNSRSSVTVAGGTVGGSGTISGSVILNTGGILSPGGDGGNAHLTVGSVTWNGGGGMAFSLGAPSAQTAVVGKFTKGNAGTYNIDFENGGGIAVGTYTIITFGSTTFSASDFTYTSSLAGFSGSFSISGNTLKFTVQTLSPVVAPTITSASSTTFTLGQANSFTVTGTGNSAPTFSATGLPSWASLNPKTGVLSGTPPDATGSPFTITLTAANGATPNATQTFTLTVVQAPVITSAATTTFTATQLGSFTVTATGTPAPTFSATGLPTWATLNATTGVLSGTPPSTITTTTSFPIVVTSANGTAPNATQDFTLTVQPLEIPPAITSASLATFAVGEPGSFIVTATGAPAPTFSATGLPGWASLNATTGVLTGTPPNTTGAPFTVDLTAANGNSPNATQTFTLNVEPLQAFTGNPTATPEKDGVPNLLKYLYDIDPVGAMDAADHAALPTIGTTTIGATPYLTLTFRENPTETGLTINVQSSTDLQTWSTLTNPTIIQIGNDLTNGDPTMQAQVPVTGPRQFIRLNVTQP
jgi:T5SS/PEP-CTERM-associated repeat protein